MKSQKWMSAVINYLKLIVKTNEQSEATIKARRGGEKIIIILKIFKVKSDKKRRI